MPGFDCDSLFFGGKVPKKKDPPISEEQMARVAMARSMNDVPKVPPASERVRDALPRVAPRLRTRGWAGRAIVFHLLKNICVFPLLVCKGLFDNWIYLFFPGDSSKWKLRGVVQ